MLPVFWCFKNFLNSTLQILEAKTWATFSSSLPETVSQSQEDSDLPANSEHQYMYKSTNIWGAATTTTSATTTTTVTTTIATVSTTTTVTTTTAATAAATYATSTATTATTTTTSSSIGSSSSNSSSSSTYFEFTTIQPVVEEFGITDQVSRYSATNSLTNQHVFLLFSALEFVEQGGD